MSVNEVGDGIEQDNLSEKSGEAQPYEATIDEIVEKTVGAILLFNRAAENQRAEPLNSPPPAANAPGNAFTHRNKQLAELISEFNGVSEEMDIRTC